MKIFDVAIGNDHAGFNLKNEIMKYLSETKFKLFDCGSYNDETVDYPDYANRVTAMIDEGEAERGILICGTGIGMSIAANRRVGIRAALCTDLLMAERARLHNNANILILGSLLTKPNEAIEIVDKFITAQFEGGRHSARLHKIK